MSDLKPCPFCGGEAELEVSYASDVFHSASVECTQCEMSQREYPALKNAASRADDEKVIAKCRDDWNTRHNESQWVSLEDRLPDFEKEVLTLNPTSLFRNVNVDVMHSDRLWESECRRAKGRTYITHWMPLPEAPTEAKDDE